MKQIDWSTLPKSQTSIPAQYLTSNFSSRLFKSVHRDYDPRKTGTIRVGSLKYYREHYDEAIADQGEGTASVYLTGGRPVTLSAQLASALTGLEIMGEKVSRPGTMMMGVEKGGLEMALDVARKEVTLTGTCKFTFSSENAMVFCMTSPAAKFLDTFKGERVVWSVKQSAATEFSNLISKGLEKAYSSTKCFPGLDAKDAKKAVSLTEQGLVEYVPREAYLFSNYRRKLAALTFMRAAFIKPNGPPKNFQNEEEYRFLFRRAPLIASKPARYPEYLDIPFAPLSHLVAFH